MYSTNNRRHGAVSDRHVALLRDQGGARARKISVLGLSVQVTVVP